MGGKAEYAVQVVLTLDVIRLRGHMFGGHGPGARQFRGDVLLGGGGTSTIWCGKELGGSH
jgi:hypothetical protein